MDFQGWQRVLPDAFSLNPKLNGRLFSKQPGSNVPKTTWHICWNQHSAAGQIWPTVLLNAALLERDACKFQMCRWCCCSSRYLAKQPHDVGRPSSQIPSHLQPSCVTSQINLRHMTSQRTITCAFGRPVRRTLFGSKFECFKTKNIGFSRFLAGLNFENIIYTY